MLMGKTAEAPSTILKRGTVGLLDVKRSEEASGLSLSNAICTFIVQARAISECMFRLDETHFALISARTRDELRVDLTSLAHAVSKSVSVDLDLRGCVFPAAHRLDEAALGDACELISTSTSSKDRIVLYQETR
jgi:hypothetical protein